MAAAWQEYDKIEDLESLYEPLGLYLKPYAKISVLVQLPVLKTPGKAISTWEVMEKLKSTIKPRSFHTFKVKKSEKNFIKFEGEIESKNSLPMIIASLDKITIKLSGFTDLLKVRAAKSKLNFPTKHDWESFFRDARNMNQMKPGERPDTLYLQALPCKWFADKVISRETGVDRPSEYLVRKVFETFGQIRNIDIPMLNVLEMEKNQEAGLIPTFSFNQNLCFDAYIQFQEYSGFVMAMDSLKGMKLVLKKETTFLMSEIKVDFDKTRRLSERQIKQRKLELELYLREQRKKDEEKRKQEEAERKKKEDKQRRKEERKRRKEEQLRKKQEEERLAEEKLIAERQELLDLRKVEASRLLLFLMDKVKVKKQKEEVRKRVEELERQRLKRLEEEQREIERKIQAAKDEEERKRKELEEQEIQLREKLLQSMREKQQSKSKKSSKRSKEKSESKSGKLKSVLIVKKRKADSSSRYDSSRKRRYSRHSSTRD